jgi:hypothetical protein
MEGLLGKAKAKHRTPQEEAALQMGLEPENDPLQLQDQLANSELPLAVPPPPVAAAVPSAAAAEAAVEERTLLNDAARFRLRNWLKGELPLPPWRCTSVQ